MCPKNGELQWLDVANTFLLFAKKTASSPHTLHALDSHSFVKYVWLCLAIKRASGLSQAYVGNG
jgi:hypothetical protein